MEPPPKLWLTSHTIVKRDYVRNYLIKVLSAYLNTTYFSQVHEQIILILLYYESFYYHDVCTYLATY